MTSILPLIIEYGPATRLRPDRSRRGAVTIAQILPYRQARRRSAAPALAPGAGSGMLRGLLALLSAVIAASDSHNMSDFISLQDIEFQVFDVLDTTELCERDRFSDHDRDTCAATLDLAMRIATSKFFPHAAKLDANEPHFDGAKVSADTGTRGGARRVCRSGVPRHPCRPRVRWHATARYGRQRLCRNFRRRESERRLLPLADECRRKPAGRIWRRVGKNATTCCQCTKDGFSAPCACPSRMRVLLWATSGVARSRSVMAITEFAAARCGSAAGSMNYPRTSFTSYWPNCPMRRRV